MSRQHRTLSVIGFLLMTLGLLLELSAVPLTTRPQETAVPRSQKNPTASAEPSILLGGSISFSALDSTTTHAYKWFLFGQNYVFTPQHGNLHSGEVAESGIKLTGSGYNPIIYDSLTYTSSWSIWASTDVPGLTITAILPTKIAEKQSSAITIVIRTDSQDTTQNITLGKEQNEIPIQSANQVPASTPISQTFGPGYNMSVSASLNTSGFTTVPQEQQEQPISQEANQFTWIVTPNGSGQQTISIPITGIWIPMKKGGQPIEKPLAAPIFHFDVDKPFTSNNAAPTSSFFDLSPLNFGALILTIIGAILNIAPWILDRSREKKALGNKQVSSLTPYTNIQKSQNKRRRNRKHPNKKEKSIR